MKIKVDLLFRNREREVITMDFNSHEEALAFKGVMETVEESFREGADAVITFGDGDTNGHIIRVSDLSCFEITYLGEDE